MIVTLALTIGFGESATWPPPMAIAVSATMLVTSVLLYIAMREIWSWPVLARLGGGIVRGSSTALFSPPTWLRFFEGGWVPLLLASLVYGVMWIWHRGVAEVQRFVPGWAYAAVLAS